MVPLESHHTLAPGAECLINHMLVSLLGLQETRHILHELCVCMTPNTIPSLCFELTVCLPMLCTTLQDVPSLVLVPRSPLIDHVMVARKEYLFGGMGYAVNFFRSE